MLDHILKISRPGVFDIRCLRWNTAIIVFMKDAAWIEDDIKVVTECPCLLGQPGPVACISCILTDIKFLFLEQIISSDIL